MKLSLKKVIKILKFYLHFSYLDSISENFYIVTKVKKKKNTVSEFKFFLKINLHVLLNDPN